MIRRTVVPYTLAMFLTAPWLAAADPPQAPPEATLLVARDVPQGDQPAPSMLRIVGVMTSEGTCWQVAKLCNLGVPTQVFFCVAPSQVGTPAENPLRNVPPLSPRHKTVNL